MRVISINNNLYFLKAFFAQRQSEINQTQRFPALTKDGAEMAAIFLIYAVLFVAASFWTMEFLGLIVLLFKHVFFAPLIFEIQETSPNFTGLNESVFIESVFLNF